RYQELPERLGKFNLEVAPDKTRIHRFSRFHSGLKRRFAFLGFEFYWGHDKKGTARVKKRTCRVKLRAALRNFTAWIRTNHHKRLKYLMKTLVSKLRGYYNYYGMIGNYRSLCYFHMGAIGILFKWLNHRSQRASYNWKGFKEMLKRFDVLRPLIFDKRGAGKIWFLDCPC
ncbi:MAG: group II intron reverse transcriptase/maturase, partial [Deltaproteobacteria bacterium]|nr:group II intron reverse transcriptase/maturase [Deltaproteobacteria bacterium]MDL1962430.1 group II intron reverse transcriptase/maturase [Deltaproteobacteria bacterium]